MGKFREHFAFFTKFSHFFLKMGELFAHFERKNGKISGKTHKNSETFSRLFPVQYDVSISLTADQQPTFFLSSVMFL